MYKRQTLYGDLWLESGKGKVVGYDLQKMKQAEVPFLRRKLGIVFQDFQLFFDRNVEENLEFVLRATGWTDKSAIKTRISDVLMQVGLGTSPKKTVSYTHLLAFQCLFHLLLYQ